MMSHLRRSKEKGHVLFKEAFWKTLFPVGYRKKAIKLPTIEERVGCLIRLYGEQPCLSAIQSAIKQGCSIQSAIESAPSIVGDRKSMESLRSGDVGDVAIQKKAVVT
jgi:hypothetical protein